MSIRVIECLLDGMLDELNWLDVMLVIVVVVKLVMGLMVDGVLVLFLVVSILVVVGFVDEGVVLDTVVVVVGHVVD